MRTLTFAAYQCTLFRLHIQSSRVWMAVPSTPHTQQELTAKAASSTAGFVSKPSDSQQVA